MKVTIHDVARHAGVSVATASRTLSGSRPVTPELAARVTDAARVLGYRHNTVARALRRRQTNTVGMIVPEISNPFFPAIVEAVERGFHEKDIDLFLCDAQLDTETERRRIIALLSRQVDGLVIIPVSAADSRRSLLETRSGTPVVQMDRYVEDYPADWVGVDDLLGISEIVTHIASLGASRCAFVSARQTSSSARQRLEGFRETASTAGFVQYDMQLLGEFSAEWGRTAALEILSSDPRPDAVVCGNDEIAIGLLREFRRHGVRVPEDILVTGFDDIRLASLTDPPITTMRQPREQLAKNCIRLLEERTADPDSPVQRIALAPVLVIRESTGGSS